MTTLGELFKQHDRSKLPMVCEVFFGSDMWFKFSAYFIDQNGDLYGKDSEGSALVLVCDLKARLPKKTKTYYPFLIRYGSGISIDYFTGDEDAKAVHDENYIGPAPMQPIEVEECH